MPSLCTVIVSLCRPGVASNTAAKLRSQAGGGAPALGSQLSTLAIWAQGWILTRGSQLAELPSIGGYSLETLNLVQTRRSLDYSSHFQTNQERSAGLSASTFLTLTDRPFSFW